MAMQQRKGILSINSRMTMENNVNMEGKFDFCNTANFPGIVILNLISYITKLGFPL